MSSTGIKVINAKKKELQKLGYDSLQAFLDADKNHMYVGRNMSFYVHGATKSKWHNPYTLKAYKNNINLVLDLYEKHIRTGPLYDQLEELCDKTLACWCHPEPCHTHVLQRLVLEKLSSEKEL